MTSSPVTPLFTRALRGWFGAKGFWLVIAAALLPLVLTGAWVATHRVDIAVTEIKWASGSITEGTNITFHATVQNVGSAAAGAFNVTLQLGTEQCIRFVPGSITAECAEARLVQIARAEERIEGLGVGETRDVSLSWNATPGVIYVLGTADSADAPGHENEGEIGESDELNNQKVNGPFAVGFAAPDPASAPAAPTTLGGDANATVATDLAIVSITDGDGAIHPNDNRTIAATVENRGATAVTNASVTLRVGQVFQGSFFPSKEETQGVDLAPGETKIVTLSWPATEGAFWEEAFIVPPANVSDPDTSNNHATRAVTVDPVAKHPSPFENPPPKYTIKLFYGVVLGIYLRFVIPLIALFYAAGVIADERDRRVLTYILTKPTPRWIFPITKFVASFLVAAVAATIGVLATYALLFGTTTDAADIGFLTAPLFVSLLAILAYGAVFTLFGVYFERPFLAGLAFIAWEAIVVPFIDFGGKSTTFLADWMRNLSVYQHVLNALLAWPRDQGLLWLPTGDGGVRAVLVLVAIAVGALIAAATVMRRKEFEG